MSLLINSYRFAAPVSAPAAWSTLHDGAFTSFSSNWSNYTIRTYLGRSMLPAGATKIRVTFGSSSAGGMQIGKAYVGPSDLHVYNVAPTQIFFGGSASHLISGANNTILSDEVNITYDGTTDICISLYIPSGSAPNDNVGSITNLGDLLGAQWVGGDSANTTGGSWTYSTGTLQGIRKIEIYTGGTWKNIFKSHNGYPTNWNNYTIRSKIDVGQYTLARTIARIGIACRVTEMFIGVSAGGASPFDFAATPTRLTFGGNNGTPATDFRVHLTDEFDMSVFDPTKPLLLSYHSATTRINQRSSPPSGQSSRYKSGNSANTVTWQTGSSSWGSYLGPAVIDEKY